MSGSNGTIGNLVRHFRLRHGLNRRAMAHLLGTEPRRVAAWERGEAEPKRDIAARLAGLLHDLPSELLCSLSSAIQSTGLPRALSRTSRLNLQAVSGPAVDKRPEIRNWIGEELAPVACGVLETMLADHELQRAIRRREVARVVSTTRSVLRTETSETIGAYRTTINYFFHDGVQFSDAIAVRANDDERLGYTPIFTEELGADLFGDQRQLEAALELRPARRVRRAGP